jgi:hypothetical protein
MLLWTPTVLNLVFSGLVAVSTIVYAVLTYKNILGSHIQSSYLLKFDHFDGMSDTSDKRLGNMAAALVKIEKSISGLASGAKKIQVIAYSPADIKREHGTK